MSARTMLLACLLASLALLAQAELLAIPHGSALFGGQDTPAVEQRPAIVAQHAKQAKKGKKVKPVKSDACRPIIIAQDFTTTSKLNTAFRLDAGSPSQLKFSKSKGLTMTLSKKSDNIVIRSVRSFSIPYSYKVVAQSSGAPGIVSTAILRGADGSDEIDLEWIGADPKSLQTVIWTKGKRVWFNTNPAPSKFDASKAFHTYQVSVTATNFTLAVDGKVIRTKQRGSTPWPTQTIPFGMGPWASDSGADWAGVLNWSKNPAPFQAVKSVVVTGCST